MRAVVGYRLGGPSCYAIDNVAVPTCAAEGVVVDVHYAGVSLVDCLIAAGKYQVRPGLPFTPGSEFSGIVRQVGSDVAGLAVGQMVAGSALGGAFAESISLPATSVHALPSGVDMQTGAIYRVSYATAYNALVRRAALQAGESVLILGASGAVGTAAVQVAKALGAWVIASASGEAKRAFALEQGADLAIDARSEDWRAELRSVSDGVDVVIDPVGGNATEPAFRSLRWGGRHVIVGFAAGSVPKLPVNLPLLKGAALLGTDLRQFGMKDPGAMLEDTEAIWDLFRRGLTMPSIAAIYPLAEFSQAMEAVLGQSSNGRIMLAVQRAATDAHADRSGP